MEKRFPGIHDGRFAGGRLDNYTDDPCSVVGKVMEELNRIREVIDHHPGLEPFELILILML